MRKAATDTTTTSRLCLPHSLLHTLLDQAQASPYTEICGFIARSDRTFSLYPMTNIAAQPDRHFEMAPSVQLMAFTCMRGADESLIAIYHSHPKGQARPSATDLQNHHYPAAAALILAPQSTHKPVRAWQMRADGEAELAINPVKANWRDGFEHGQ